MLADRPRQLVMAAEVLHPEARSPERRPFLQKALTILGPATVTSSTEELHLRAQLHDGLGESSAAASAYQAALEREPRQTTWRYEFALMLENSGRHKDARQQLLILATDRPNYPEAKRLLETVLRQLADQE